MKILLVNGNADEYYKRIQDAAEKLHRDADKLRSKKLHSMIIEWEDFTINYIKDSLPKNKLEHRIWIEKRANGWKDSINNYFCSVEYSEWLFVEYSKGIRLEVDILAARRLQLQSLKRECGVASTWSNRLIEFSGCFTGQVRNELRRLASWNIDMMRYIQGQIALDNSLPKRHRDELITMIGGVLPKEKDE